MDESLREVKCEVKRVSCGRRVPEILCPSKFSRTLGDKLALDNHQFDVHHFHVVQQPPRIISRQGGREAWPENAPVIWTPPHQSIVSILEVAEVTKGSDLSAIQ